MTTTRRRDRDEKLCLDPRDDVNDLIGEHVIHLLGTPDDLLQVQVRWVGGDRCRVNIFVGKDVTSGRVAHSFYLTTDGEGHILTSSPEVARVYRADGG
jgi:hypothetical protein